MNPYLFTIAFLMMMSFLTSSEVIRYSKSSLDAHCFKNSCQYLVAAEEIRELSKLESLKKKKIVEETPDKDEEEQKPTKAKKSAPYVKKIGKLGINAARPPNNARLNFYTLLHKEPHKNTPQEFSLYETTAQLMRILYSNESFFQQIQDAEYLILDKLIEKKEETLTFATPDQLSTLLFEDENLQSLFIKMLKGTTKAPSLLNYITFDLNSEQEQARKISFLFADPDILRAIFNGNPIAEKLIEQRDQIWEKIDYQEKHRTQLTTGSNRTDFSTEIKEILDQVLSSANLNSEKYKSHVFDYTLGKPGTIIFLKDPLTGNLHREKYIHTTR